MPLSIDTAVHRLVAALKPIAVTLQTPDGPARLLAKLGWDVPPGVRDVGLAAFDLRSLLDALSKVKASISIGEGGVQLASEYAQLGIHLANFLQGIDAIVAGFNGPADYLTKTNITAEFLPRFFDYVSVTAIMSQGTLAIGPAMMLGIVELRPFNADSSIYQVDHVRRIMHWDRVPRVFTDIKGLLSEVYGWGVAGRDPTALVIALSTLLSAFSVSTEVRALPRRAEWGLVGHDVPEADTNPMTQTLVSFTRNLGWNNVNAGVSVITLRPSVTGGTDAGLAIAPYFIGTTDLQFPLTEDLTLIFDASAALADGVAVVLRPGASPKIRNNLLGGAAPTDAADGRLTLALQFAPAGGSRFGLLTVTDGIGIDAESLTFGGGASISGGVLSPVAFVRIKGGRFSLDSSQMDSFLAKLIPVSIDASFNFGVGWSGAYGFFFEGNASPAITIGLHQSLGPFTLDTLHAGLTVGGGDTLPFELSLTGKGSLGPFKVSVDRIGMNLAIAFHKGNLGPIDFSLSFKPPNGLGMELDAGLISGGGFLYTDQAKHRYAGILDCSIADIVQVKIIGVLDTILPDGRPEFSLLLVITTDFPPIQLSFGFTLNGVGGIGAVNRTMALDALRAGLRAHHLDSILFPNDPIDNAPQIISDLSSFFPPADGRYVFGPIFSLGWGTPTLITLNLGVILEIPDPVRLAILGQIKTALPSDDFAIIELHIDVLGVVDFGAKLLSIDGSLFDSRVTIYSVMGDMALRLGWGDNPNFALSVGGLNPRFQPPANFPTLHRCSVCIGLGDNPRLSSNSYFAVTSNSLQFGANVDLYAAAGGFSIHGFIGWDALFIISPFSFVIDFSAGLDVEFEGESLCGIHVDGMIAGPRPWHVHGDASFHILFIDVSASVDLLWGDRDPVVLPPVQVLPDLQKALADPRSWSTVMPGGLTQAVSLAPRPPGDKTLIVHPAGTLQVREKVVPLDQTITKYGNARPTDGTYFTISSVTIDGRPETQQKLTDEFAIGQYTDLSDDQKLTAPSYQPMNSGISIGSSDVVFSRDVPCIVAYKDGYIDEDDQPLRIRGIFVLPRHVHLAYSRLGAGFVSALRTKGVSQFTEPGTVSAVKTSDLQYVIASTEDLSIRTDIISGPVTQFEAYNLLNARLAANPSERGAVQVVAIHEVAA
jgi:hypothetical protein